MDTRGQSAGNEELAWLAGFWDGEGSLMLQLRKVNRGQHIVPEAQVSNTHKPTIERISDILKRRDVGHHVQTRLDRRSNVKTQFVVRIAGMKRVAKFVSLVKPYLFTKSDQAALISAFIEKRLSGAPCIPYGETENSIYRAIRAANRIGTSEAICSAPNVIVG